MVRRWIPIGLLVAASALLETALPVRAAPGDLDPAFGTGGVVTTAITAGNDTANAVALQADGKVVAVGQARLGTSYDFAVVRYLANGSLDPGFGAGGVVTTAIGQGTDIAQGVAVEPDGRLLATGWAFVAGRVHDFAVVRYLPDGRFDPSWGGTGRVTTNIGPAAKSDDAPYAIVRQGDGRLVVAGETFDPATQRIDVALVRYLTTGELDATFGGGGIVVTRIGLGGSARALVQQADGRLVVAGRSTASDGFHVTLARYTPGGALDPTFGAGGVVVTRIGAEEGVAWDVVQQPNGALVVAGDLYDADTQTTDVVLVRYGPGGALDPTFGGTGVVVTPIGAHSGARALVRDGTRLVIAGFSSGPGVPKAVTVARYDANGALDPGFGPGGVVRTPVGGASEARALALQQDGRLVAAGSAFTVATGNDVALLRYETGSAGGTTSTTVTSSTAPSSSTTSVSTSSTTVTSIGGEVPVELSFRSLGALDGTVIESSETSNAGGVVPPAGGHVEVGDQAADRQVKGILSFDTSAIPDGATVVSATLRLRRVGVYGTNPFTVLGACRIAVRTGFFGGDVALEPGDFEAPATAVAGILADAPANGQLAVGTLEAAGRAAINRAGTTQIRLAFDLDDNDNGLADRVRFASGDQADPALRPELLIAYQP